MAAGNQHTYNHMAENFNVRLDSETQRLLKAIAERRHVTRADLVREALKHYLPILENLDRALSTPAK